jgi:hypothetical protein
MFDVEYLQNPQGQTVARVMRKRGETLEPEPPDYLEGLLNSLSPEKRAELKANLEQSDDTSPVPE